MKKKLLTLLLAFSLVLSNTMVVSAEGEVDAQEPTTLSETSSETTSETSSETIETRYTAIESQLGQPVEGDVAVSKVGTDGYVILDVRNNARYSVGHLNGSIHVPVFAEPTAENPAPTGAVVTSVTDELAQKFIETVTAKKADLDGKEIYILCNGGRSGAKAASVLLVEAGFTPSKLHTITGGAGGADVAAACKFVLYDYALAADGIILDVRATDVYYRDGYVDKSLHQPLFFNQNDERGSGVTTQSDVLATDFNAFVDANNALLSSKNIYVLCNGGARGAKAATALLAAKGITNVYTIEKGAGSNIKTYFVNNQIDVTGAQAVAALENENVVIIDVRAPERRDENGFLPGSLHCPLFTAVGTANQVSSGYDALAMNFLAFVEDNAASLEGKQIYVLCNGGASGAKAATKLLMQAGYSTKDIHTIINGAKDADVQAAFVKYNYISGQDAVTNAKSGDEKEAVIIDVRATVVGDANGTLDETVYDVYRQPLFTYDGKNNVPIKSDDEQLAVDFTNFVTDNSDLAGKDIYILCNSGATGAANATRLLKAAGYADSNIFTITNGAKGLDMKYAFLGTDGNPVTSEKALEEHAKILKDANHNVVILDVRATGTYGSGHLKGVPNVPLFTSEGAVPTADAELAKAFTEYVTANKDTLKNKEIYILCNGGQSGARAATVLLEEANYDLTKVHTITGGYNKNDNIKAAAIYVSPERAVNVAENPTKESNKNILIVDVRSADKYEAGHLKGSLSLPLFDADNNLTDELADEFVAYVKANMKDFEGKTIYILCNSGARGAEKATKLLAELGITAVFTIEGGAKNEVIQKYFVTADDAATGNGSSTGAVKTGDNANITLYTLAMAISLLAVVAIGKRKLSK